MSVRASLGATPALSLGATPALIVMALLGACARDPATRAQAPGVGEAPGWIPPGLERRAVDFHGTCEWARPAGAPEQYRVRLRVRGSPGSTIRVRSDARFDPADDGNRIGELPAGARVLGDGPLASGHRVGYAVLVRGDTGRICRGYVAATAVMVERGSSEHERERQK